MPDLPSGTVTFLFTDIEGSTALWERDRAAMATAVERHLALLRDGDRGPRRGAVQDRGGRGPGGLSHRSRCHRCRRRCSASLAGGAVARPAGTPSGAHGAACRGSRPARRRLPGRAAQPAGPLARGRSRQPDPPDGGGRTAGCRRPAGRSAACARSAPTASGICTSRRRSFRWSRRAPGPVPAVAEPAPASDQPRHPAHRAHRPR